MTNRPRKTPAQWREEVLGALRASRSWMSCYDLAVAVTGAPRGMQNGRQTQLVRDICGQLAADGLADRRKGDPKTLYRAKLPRIVCLCGSTRFYDEFQRANYDRTMAGDIVLSVGFYPHATAEHGHGEGIGHDSAQKAQLDELHLRKVDLADYVLVVSDESGYFGESTAREIGYAVRQGKPVEFTTAVAGTRAKTQRLLS